MLWQRRALILTEGALLFLKCVLGGRSLCVTRQGLRKRNSGFCCQCGGRGRPGGPRGASPAAKPWRPARDQRLPLSCRELAACEVAVSTHVAVSPAPVGARSPDAAVEGGRRRAAGPSLCGRERRGPGRPLASLRVSLRLSSLAHRELPLQSGTVGPSLLSLWALLADSC